MKLCLSSGYNIYTVILKKISQPGAGKLRIIRVTWIHAYLIWVSFLICGFYLMRINMIRMRCRSQNLMI